MRGQKPSNSDISMSVILYVTKYYYFGLWNIWAAAPKISGKISEKTLSLHPGKGLLKEAQLSRWFYLALSFTILHITEKKEDIFETKELCLQFMKNKFKPWMPTQGEHS